MVHRRRNDSATHRQAADFASGMHLHDVTAGVDADVRAQLSRVKAQCVAVLSDEAEETLTNGVGHRRRVALAGAPQIGPCQRVADTPPGNQRLAEPQRRPATGTRVHLRRVFRNAELRQSQPRRLGPLRHHRIDRLHHRLDVDAGSAHLHRPVLGEVGGGGKRQEQNGQGKSGEVRGAYTDQRPHRILRLAIGKQTAGV